MKKNEYSSIDNFEYLQGGPSRGEKIFVGDHPDAERCKVLRLTTVERNWPSQWHSKFPRGYIKLADRFRGGDLFDLDRRTINGKEAYIFKYSEAINVLYLRLRALAICRRHADELVGEDLFAYAELVLREYDPALRVWRSEDWARRQIKIHLPGLHYGTLELLAEAARPGTVAIPKLSRSRAS